MKMVKKPMSRAERRRAEVVARAAAVGKNSNGRSGAELSSRRRFLTVVASIVLLGTLAVGYIWADRQYNHPTVLDSWQNAYGVFDCQDESWLEPFESRANPDGFRSRGDGIVYVEPATEAVAGDNATIDRFLTAMGADLTDESLRLPDGAELSEEGTFCNGEEAVLQVHRWEHGEALPTEVRTTDLAQVQFLHDLDSFAIVLAPANAIVPAPPTTADLPDPGITGLAADVDG